MKSMEIDIRKKCLARKVTEKDLDCGIISILFSSLASTGALYDMDAVYVRAKRFNSNDDSNKRWRSIS